VTAVPLCPIRWLMISIEVPSSERTDTNECRGSRGVLTLAQAVAVLDAAAKSRLYACGAVAGPRSPHRGAEGCHLG
jgi:hypothetical protein